MSEKGAPSKNIPLHPIVEYHPYTIEHYSPYNNNIFLEPNKYVAMVASFFLGFSDACFNTQVKIGLITKFDQLYYFVISKTVLYFCR